MRITNGMSINNFLSDMQGANERMNKFSNQVATNQRITSLADDPIGVVNSLTARQNLLKYNQYLDTTQAARSWVETAESAVRDINQSVIDIKELTTQAASGTNGATDRDNIAKAVEQLVGNIFQLGNSTVSGQYIFAGYNTTKPPFSRNADGKVLYNGVDLTSIDPIDVAKIEQEGTQHVEFNVGFGNNMQVSVNGVQLAGTGENNIFAKLDGLVTAIKDGSSSETLSGMLRDLENIQTKVLENVVDMGGQMSEIELLTNRYSMDIINCMEIKSQVEDVSQGEAIMNLKMTEAVYRQALAAGARIIQPSLGDFLN